MECRFHYDTEKQKQQKSINQKRNVTNCTKSLLHWLTATKNIRMHSVLVELERTVGQCDIASSIQPVISTG